MITIFNKDNLSALEELSNQTIQFKVIYIDPPYNTGNKFNYNDKVKKSEWFDNIDKRLESIKSKQLLLKNGCVIFSISEDSLLDSLILLNKHFKYVFPPFCWLTKSNFNQNKVNTVNSVVHEYVIVASDEKIESNLEVLDEKEKNEKYKNYPLSICLKEKPKYIKKDGKEYLKFINFSINKDREETSQELKDFLMEKYNLNLNNQIFQKRTKQKNHGSERYYNNLIQLEEFDPDALFVLLNVKDKNNLNGKFLLNNSYFQSIKKEEIKIKIPSFLGYYQPGIKGFQTAKPINLMKRLINAFSNENDKILDLYSGSGNVLRAIIEEKRIPYGVEIDKDKSLDLLKQNLKKYELIII